MRARVLADQQVVGLETEFGLVHVLELIVRLVRVDKGLLVPEPDGHPLEDLTGQVHYTDPALEDLRSKRGIPMRRSTVRTRCCSHVLLLTGMAGVDLGLVFY